MATGRAGRKEQGGTDPKKAAATPNKAAEPVKEQQSTAKTAEAPKTTTRTPAKGKAAPANTEVSKPDPRKTDEAAKAPKRPQVKPEELNERGQYLGKYAERQRRADEAEVEYDPDWRYKDVVVVAGIAPNSETSVMGQLHKIAKEAGKNGISGKELAVKLRHTPNIGARSKYTTGLPPVGWSEDYVNGALRGTPAVLRISENQPAKEAEKESKEE